MCEKDDDMVEMKIQTDEVMDAVHRHMKSKDEDMIRQLIPSSKPKVSFIEPSELSTVKSVEQYQIQVLKERLEGQLKSNARLTEEVWKLNAKIDDREKAIEDLEEMIHDLYDAAVQAVKYTAHTNFKRRSIRAIDQLKKFYEGTE